MHIGKLKSFLKLIELENFTETAEQLFLSQSSLSKHIASLEKELNVRLFDRSTRKISLSDNGKVVAEYAKQIVEAYDNMIKHCTFNENFLSLATTSVILYYDIYPLINSFTEEHPIITTRIYEIETSNILNGLINNDYNLAFMRSDMINRNKYDTITIFSDQLCAILPLKHRLSINQKISTEELSNEKFMLLNQGSIHYYICLNACKNSGFEPNIVSTSLRFENIVDSVASGSGISLIMERVLNNCSREDIVIIPLTPPIRSNISLVRKKTTKLTKQEQLFWSFVRDKYL